MPGCTASPALHFLDYYQVFHPSDLKREPRNSSNASVKNKTPRKKKKNKTQQKQSQKALSISSQEEKSAYLCYRQSIIKHPLPKDRE